MRAIASFVVLVIGLANVLFGSLVFTDETQTPGVLWARSASLVLGLVTVVALWVYQWLGWLAIKHLRAANDGGDHYYRTS